MVEEVVNERLVELHHRIMDRVRQELEAFEERIVQRGVDEKSIRTLVRAVVGQEIARMDSTIMENISTLKVEIEELSKQGVNAETVRRLVDEIYNKLLSDLSSIVDKRIIHVLDTINEQSNSIKDVLDLVNEVLKLEVEFEEKIEELRNTLSEEALEERFYRMLMKKGVIRQRRRRWAPLIAGLGVLAAIVTGLLVNPIATLVILFIVFAILLRW